MGKSSLWGVPIDHFHTLYDARTHKIDKMAMLFQVGVPCAVGIGLGLIDAKLRDVNGAVSGVSIVSGLLFSMAIFLFQLRISLDQDKRLARIDYRLLDECMANVLWAILWGLTLTIYLVIVDAGGWIQQGSWATWFTGVAAAAGTHFLIVIMMCIKRLRRAYERIAIKRA